MSDFYRADGLATATANPERRAELEDIGLARMLARSKSDFYRKPPEAFRQRHKPLKRVS